MQYIVKLNQSINAVAGDVLIIAIGDDAVTSVTHLSANAAKALTRMANEAGKRRTRLVGESRKEMTRAVIAYFKANPNRLASACCSYLAATYTQGQVTAEIWQLKKSGSLKAKLPAGNKSRGATYTVA